MLVLLASILSIFGISRKITKEDSRKSLCDDYPLMNCIEFSGVSGDYADSNYVTLHKVNNTRFTYKATSENSSHPLKNAFDTDDSKTYWAASTPNSDTFHNTITVEFNETVTLEAVLYYASFFTRNTRIFNGAPTKLKIFSSINNGMFQLEGIFVATLKSNWEQFQFVFSSPVSCDKIKLEFIEVTANIHTSNGATTPVTGGITFIQQYGENETAYTNKNGNFANDDYFNSHKITKASFTYTSTPSKNNHPIDHAFDDFSLNTYWVPLYPNNDTFRNSITVTFNDIYSIEGFVYFPAYNTKNGIRVFQGAPTRLNVYTSVGNEKLELRQVFYGNPQDGWRFFQFLFKKPVRCNKIMLEFAKVTPDHYDSNGAPHPVVGDLQFITDAPKEAYTSTNTINNDKIQLNEFTYESSPSHSNYPIKNAFDDNDRKDYWVGSDPNNDTFNNYITVNFKKTQAVKAFTYFPAYNTANNNRVFQGTPLKLYVLAAMEENKFELRNIFVSTPQNDWELLLFTFSNPIVCKHLKLQFVEVTPDNGMLKDGKQHPSTGGITFYKTTIPAATPVPPATAVPPKATPARTPFPPAYSCGEGNNRCDIKNNDDKPAHVSVGLTNFTNLKSDDDGGAIHLINSALECENVKFESCIAQKGGGGGVYIDNSVESNNDVRLDNLNFVNCKALYGGAVYIRASSPSVTATIRNCMFKDNEATAPNTDSMNGGSALYLNVRNGLVQNNEFSGNKGNLVKVVNEFDNKYAMLLDFVSPSVLMTKCKFENDDDSSSTLFYVAGNNGVKFEVKECIFFGSLSEGGHHIDGLSLSKDSHKLHLNKCKFSLDSQSIMNLNADNSYLSFDLKNQVFNFDPRVLNKSNEKRESSWPTLANLILVGSALVVVALLAIILKIKRQNQINDPNDDSSENNNESLAGQSLV